MIHDYTWDIVIFTITTPLLTRNRQSHGQSKRGPQNFQPLMLPNKLECSLLLPLALYNVHLNVQQHERSVILSVILRELMYNWLVGSTILKNMKVNGKDHPIYYGK